jgi:hypothetical protein
MGNQASSRRSSNASQSNPHAVAAGAPSGPSVSAVHDYLTVDGGLLYPATGIYKHVKQEWDQAVVHRLIQDRKLAPFYRGLQDEYSTRVSTTARQTRPQPSSSPSSTRSACRRARTIWAIKSSGGSGCANRKRTARPNGKRTSGAPRNAPSA